MTERPSAGTARITDSRWRSVIRVFAVVMAVIGLAFIVTELFENISSCNAGQCSRVHLSTMLWGVTLMALGMLVLQKGDVSLSIREIAETGTVVRGWWGRRSYDKAAVAVPVPVIVEGTPVPSVVTVDPNRPQKDD